MQVEIADHAELEGRVELPCGLGFGDGDDVDEMKHDLHGEEGDQEADPVEGGSGTGYAFGGIAGLGDVVIKGKDRAGEVERGVESVSKIIPEAVLVRLCGNVDSISFGQGGGVQLLLLDKVSHVYADLRLKRTSKALPFD